VLSEIWEIGVPSIANIGGYERPVGAVPLAKDCPAERSRCATIDSMRPSFGAA